MPNNLLPITVDWHAPTHEIRQKLCDQINIIPVRIKITFPENSGMQSRIYNIENLVQFLNFLVKISSLGTITSQVCPEILPSLAIVLDG